MRAYLAADDTAKAKLALVVAKAAPAGGDAFVAAVRLGDGDRTKTADALLRVGQVALRERRSDDALGAFQEAVVLAPKAGNAHLLLGSAYYNLKDYPRAIQELGEATRIEPRTIGAWKLLGHSHSQAGDKAQAVAAYRKVMELAPNDPDAPAAIARLEGRPPPPPPSAPIPAQPGAAPPGSTPARPMPGPIPGTPARPAPPR